MIGRKRRKKNKFKSAIFLIKKLMIILVFSEEIWELIIEFDTVTSAERYRIGR